MRVKVSRRLIGMCLLFAVLCLTPATLPTAYAKPISWQDLPDPNNPAPAPGDGDGTVVKASVMLPTTTTYAMASGKMSFWSLVREYLRLVRMGYGSRL